MLISLRIYLSCQDSFPDPFITKHDFSILYELLCMKIWVTFVEALLDESLRVDLADRKGISWTLKRKLGLFATTNSSPDISRCWLCNLQTSTRGRSSHFA